MRLHGIEGNTLLSQSNAKDHPTILAGKESLGDADEEPSGKTHNGERKKQGCESEAQGLLQAPIVCFQQPVEAALKNHEEKAMLGRLSVAKKATAEHGGESQRDDSGDQHCGHDGNGELMQQAAENSPHK